MTAHTSFHFRAVASDGKVRTGVVSAESEKRVAQELKRQGLVPLYVGAGKPRSLNVKLPLIGGNRRKDILYFTQELSTLLTSGIPLDRALSITSELTEKERFRTIVLDVLRVLKGGKSLADSLATHPEYFSDLFVNMVRAGEASGTLASIFERLAEFERTRDDLRSYIVSSMVYPGLLCLVGFGSVMILLNFVVPRFASVFEGSHLKIPTPTLIMLQVSAFVKAYGWIGITVIVVAVLVHQTYIRTSGGRLWWDKTRLRIPLLGDALRKAETSRFARAMGTLVSNSVPLVQSLSISRAILNNLRIANALEAVAQGIKRGEGIAAPLTRCGEFPPLAGHLLAVGEETGHLDTMFLRMADIYDGETRAAIKRFTTLFEPLIILIMGVVVGAMILSMLIAITSINDVAG
jgi:general secretion pathway protein F